MSGTDWYTLTQNTKARASEVLANMEWYQGNFVPFDVGSKTNAVYDLGEASYKWRNLYISDKIYLGTTTSYIHADSTNSIQVVTNDSPVMTFNLSQQSVIPTTTRYLSIPPSAFVQYAPGNDYFIGGSAFAEATITSSNWVSAPVFLPNNATIISLKGFWVKDTQTSNCYTRLYRVDPTVGTVTANTIASINLNDYFDTITGIGFLNTETSDITLGTIDNSSYLYHIQSKIGRGNPGVNECFGFIIKYTITEPLP